MTSKCVDASFSQLDKKEVASHVLVFPRSNEAAMPVCHFRSWKQKVNTTQPPRPPQLSGRSSTHTYIIIDERFPSQPELETPSVGSWIQAAFELHCKQARNISLQRHCYSITPQTHRPSIVQHFQPTCHPQTSAASTQPAPSRRSNPPAPPLSPSTGSSPKQRCPQTIRML